MVANDFLAIPTLERGISKRFERPNVHRDIRVP